MTNIVTVRKFSRSLGHPKGAYWEISDATALAGCIAKIALGQWKHAESLLDKARILYPHLPTLPVDSAKNLLVVPSGQDPWHRDGWIFQCISWIAAVEASEGPVRQPHMILAHKGFDGLQLVLNKDGSKVRQLLVFEDKATSAPRDMIRTDVWPSFGLLHGGERNSELSAEFSALLERAPDVDVVAAANTVFRDDGLAYRAALTVGASHGTDEGIIRLFKGFDGVVPGRRRKRRGHVLYLGDLRGWMQEIADLTLLEIDRLAGV